MLWEDANVGIIEEILPSTQLLGAENNGKVTCYLDSLLFALYARLDSFEVSRQFDSTFGLSLLIFDVANVM